MKNKFEFENYLKNNPLLKEEEEVVVTAREMKASPFKHTGNVSKSITIPQGSKIKVLQRRFDNQPNDGLIEYNGEKYVVTASILGLSLKEDTKKDFEHGDMVKIHGDIAVDVAGGNVKGEIHDGPFEDGTYTVLVGPKRMPKEIDGKFLRPLNKAQ
jgi:hypothetical protein